MAQLNRRELIRSGVIGVAAGGAASLMLRADAKPTEATGDAHGYEKFLDKNGIPQIQPTEKWEPSGEDILGPFWLAGAPFRGKVCPPLEPGELLVIKRPRLGFRHQKANRQRSP